MSLTGNDDVNAKILLSFSYQDRMNACQANQYINTLCHNNIDLRHKLTHAKNKANFIIHLFDQGKYRKQFILQNLDENEPFTSFETILHYMNIGYNNIHGDKYLTHRYFLIDIRSDGFLIRGHGNFFDTKMTIDQLYTFIMICYYNNIVI